jgi:hypothetical protein
VSLRPGAGTTGARFRVLSVVSLGGMGWCTIKIMRFPRVIRLDESDSHVYDRPAVPGEWAVPGSFVFLEADPATLNGKQQEAFRHGFLGTVSFGWSTLVAVYEISDEEYQAVIERLAAHFVQHYGAPDRTAALTAAREEAGFAASLCDHEIHTVLALERKVEGESIVESFRVVRPPGEVDHTAVKLWAVDDD